MKKLLTILLVSGISMISFAANEKNSSSHLEDVSIKEKLVNELLVNEKVKEKGKPLEDEKKEFRLIVSFFWCTYHTT